MFRGHDVRGGRGGANVVDLQRTGRHVCCGTRWRHHGAMKNCPGQTDRCADECLVRACAGH